MTAAGDAGPDQRPVQVQDFHRTEAGFGVAGAFEDDVRAADLLRQFVQRRLLHADVRGPVGFGDLRLAVRTGFGRQRVDLQPAQPEHHRGQQADLSRPHDKRPLGFPDLQPLLCEKHLLQRLRTDAGRFRQHPQMLQLHRHPDDVFGVVHEGLGHVAVTQVDAPFVVRFFAGDVVASDDVKQRTTGPTHGAGNVVAHLQLGHLVADFNDLPETLVADHQMLAARRGVAVQRLVDFPVGGVDADLQRLDQHRPPFRDAANVRMRLVRQLGGRNVTEVNAIGLTGQNGNGFHRKSLVEVSETETFPRMWKRRRECIGPATRLPRTAVVARVTRHTYCSPAAPPAGRAARESPRLNTLLWRSRRRSDGTTVLCRHEH